VCPVRAALGVGAAIAVVAALGLLPPAARIPIVARVLAGTRQAQTPTFKSAPQIIVPIMVTVTDAEQRLITDLVRDDFQVLDNDNPQSLVVFDNTNQPITLVAMLDMSGSMTGNLDFLRRAAEQFLIRLFPKDQARIGSFSEKIQIEPSDFTSNRDTLVAAVKKLDYGNDTHLWDAIDASLDTLSGHEGRRVVLVFTDGADSNSHTTAGAVLDRARKDEVTIYAITLESIVDNQKTKPDAKLKTLAEETGGGYFQLAQTSQLGPTFTRVAQELHTQYTLGFSPETLDGKVHRLTVKIKRQGTKVRARRNYLAKLPEKAPAK
jgi:Ca-activated chloride channel family protein